MSTVDPSAAKPTAASRRTGRTKAAALLEPSATARRRRGSTAYSDMIRRTFLSRPGDTLTIAEVSDAIGQDRSAVGMGLSALARRGILLRVGTGKYQLAGAVGGPASRVTRAVKKTARTTPRPAAASPAAARHASSPATEPAAPRRGRKSTALGVSPDVAPASAAATSTLQVVFTLPTGEILLTGPDGGLWQAHRVQLVAE